MARTIKPNPNSRAARAAAGKPVSKDRGPAPTNEELEAMMARAIEASKKKKSGRPASLVNADTGEPIDDIDIAFFLERIKVLRTNGDARAAAKLLHQMWRLPDSYDPEKLRKRASPHRHEVPKPQRPKKG